LFIAIKDLKPEMNQQRLGIDWNFLGVQYIFNPPLSLISALACSFFVMVPLKVTFQCMDENDFKLDGWIHETNELRNTFCYKFGNTF